MFIFLYRVLAGLKLIHSILYSNRINQERSSSLVFEAMAKKTLLEFFAPTVQNICTGPVLRIENLEFELKPSLINMVQAIQYNGKANEDASTHLQDFMEIGNTIAIERVNQDIILPHLHPEQRFNKTGCQPMTSPAKPIIVVTSWFGLELCIQLGFESLLSWSRSKTG